MVCHIYSSSFRRQHEQLCQVIVRVLRFASPTRPEGVVVTTPEEMDQQVETLDTADASAVQVCQRQGWSVYGKPKTVPLNLIGDPMPQIDL